MRSIVILAWTILGLMTAVAMAQESAPNPPANGTSSAPVVTQDTLPDTAPSSESPAGTDAVRGGQAELPAPAEDVSAGDASGPAEIAAPLLPHNLSPWGMFMNADIVVKAVIIGLAFASLVTWTVWLAKTLELFVARMRAHRATAAIV